MTITLFDITVGSNVQQLTGAKRFSREQYNNRWPRAMPILELKYTAGQTTINRQVPRPFDQRSGNPLGSLIEETLVFG